MSTGEQLNDFLKTAEQLFEQVAKDAAALAAARAAALATKAHNLVEMLDDAEVNHGGLWSGKTMRARDELRQELSKWPK